jgi:hypothetical protein
MFKRFNRRQLTIGAIAVGLIVVGVLLSILPRLLSANPAPAVEIEPMVRPTNTPHPTAMVSPTLVVVIAPTPEIIVALAAQTPTPSPMANCESGAFLTAPRDGDSFAVGTTIVLSGTATIPNYSYHKLQYQTILTDDPGLWAEAYRSEEHPDRPYLPPVPVVDGKLATWDTTRVEPGVYRVRLMVHDLAGNFPKPCVLLITLTRAQTQEP